MVSRIERFHCTCTYNTDCEYATLFNHFFFLLLQLQLSILRTMYNILGCIGPLQPIPLLPSLLASLKAIMTTGLPGHHIKEPPLPLSPHPDTGKNEWLHTCTLLYAIINESNIVKEQPNCL